KNNWLDHRELIRKKGLAFESESSGHFTSSENGTLTYKGGEANAVNVTSETPFTDLKLRFVKICDLNRSLLIMRVRYLRGDNTMQPLFAIARGDYGAGRSNTPAIGKTVGSNCSYLNSYYSSRINFQEKAQNSKFNRFSLQRYLPYALNFTMVLSC
nr:PB1 domain-containing protein [Tanacetum cinerariifolium]